MDRTSLRRFLGVLTCAFLLGCTVFGQPRLWGNLHPGAYGVGFKSFWVFDPTRTFTYRFADGSRYDANRPPRPILVDAWYPAPAATPTPGPPMVEGDYLNFDPADGSLLSRFASDLLGKNRGVISSDVVGKPLKDLDPIGQATLQDFLKTPTQARKNADPASGRFPLVIYVQGYGSSLQDNSALCEYLASHGYVVLGSAYQDETGRMIAGRDTVAGDIGCLIKAARDMPQVDISKVALVGHSGGAQSSISYASREGSLADAVVSLDTTQDYYFNDKASFKDYLDDVKGANFKVPLLVAADRPAIFDFVDTLTRSDRLYLTVDQLGHDEYTSEGLAASIFQKKENEEAVRQRYSNLCEYVLRFLDAKLKNSTKGDLLNAPAHFSIVAVPLGTNGPALYEEGATPPTPRQFRVLLNTAPAKALAVLKRFAKLTPDAAIYDGQLAFATTDHLLDAHDVKMAKKMWAAFCHDRSKEDEMPRLFLFWGRFYASNGVNSISIAYYEKALMLDPSNKEARDALAKLKGAGK